MICVCVVYVCVSVHKCFFSLLGWWFVAKDEQEGWVPCGYLEPLNQEVQNEDDESISTLGINNYPITITTNLIN